MILFFVLLSLRRILSTRRLEYGLAVGDTSIRNAGGGMFAALRRSLHDFVSSCHFASLICTSGRHVRYGFTVVIHDIRSSLFHYRLRIRTSHPICNSDCAASVIGVHSRRFGFHCGRFSPVRVGGGAFRSGLATIVTCCTCLVVNFSLSSCRQLNKRSTFTVTRRVIGVSRSHSSTSRKRK